MQTENVNTNNSTLDGKSIAIISYLTIFGWIIAYVMHGNNKTQLGAFHLRQSLFLMLSGFGVSVLQWFLFFIPILGWIVAMLLYLGLLGLFVLWIIGLIAGINGEEKEVPFLGKKAQELLKGIQ